MTAKSSIVCLGGVVLDRIFYVDRLPAGPTKMVAEGYLERGGGMAATAATAIAALGADVELWARIGDDATGAVVSAELDRAGVDTSRLHICAGGQTATSVVHIDGTSERALTNFRGSLEDDAGWLPLEAVSRKDAVLADVRWPGGALRILRHARSLGIPSVLDADAGDPASLRELVGLADHIIFSEQGLRELTDETDPDAGLHAAATFAPGSTVLAVTLGEQGSRWLHRRELTHVPALTVEAVNTNGVGDVFHGAYVLAIAEGSAPGDAAGFATAVAALKCQDARGWDGMPTRKAADLLMSSRNGLAPSDA